MRRTWIRTDRIAGSFEQGSMSHEELILLIENDLDIADMYRMGLNQSGYPVRVATSPGSAVSQVNEPGTPPRLIVLDLELPLVSGLDVLNVLRTTPSTSDVPVIVLADDSDAFAEAYRRGATECHPKYRTTPSKLVDYISAALNEDRRRRSA